MTRDEVISRLKQHKPDLKRLGVEHLYLFGSTARGEARETRTWTCFSIIRKGPLGSFN